MLRTLKQEEIKCGLRNKENGQFVSNKAKSSRPGIQATIAKDFDIDTSLISKWKQQELDLFEANKVAKNRTKMQLPCEQSAAYFLAEEVELYECFLFYREVLGLAVDGLWLRLEFLTILENSKPIGWEEFRYSSGWVSSFCKRWDITSQAQTNKKSVPLIAKIPLVKEFHVQLLQLQLGMMCTGDCLCCDRRYGRFGPSRMFHADQIPMEFARKHARTLNCKGSACWLFSPGSSLEKRQATIMMCLRAGGDQVVKTCIIFKGVGGVSPDEMSELRALKKKLGNIRFYFQENAWANGKFMEWWLKKFRKDCTRAGLIPDHPRAGQYHVLLGLDRHSAQKTQAFLGTCVHGGVLPVYTPPDCTDCVSPCDHHVGKWLKDKMGKMYLSEVQDKRQAWAENPVAAQERRLLMLTWLGEAWKCLTLDPDFIFSTFTSTGFLMELEDPARDIKMKRIPDYDFLTDEPEFKSDP